ncbi:proton-conducting transporter membrane subunit, partial [Cribrihabitans sp. XS_ASV171]
FKDDLKALLAFSTVSHLGLITMLLGFGTKFAAVAAVFHIINHATFKAALFMSAGIVDHEAGTRDIKRLGGLRHLMPLTFTLATVAALSMAGIPPFNGFISKEMMLDATVHAEWMASPYLVPALAVLAALFSAAYSFRLIAHVFMGKERDDYPHPPHDPGPGLWLAPAILVTLVVLIGLFSKAVAGPLVATASSAVIGGEKLPYYSLKLWHGFTPALYMSIVAVLGGVILLALHRHLEKVWNALPRPEAKAIFEGIIGAFIRFSRWVTDRLHNGVISRYAAIFVFFTVGLAWYAYATGTTGLPTRLPLEAPLVPIIGWICLVAATLAIMWFHRNR